MNRPWSLTDDNAPRTLAELNGCRAYQRAADDGDTDGAVQVRGRIARRPRVPRVL